MFNHHVRAGAESCLQEVPFIYRACKKPILIIEQKIWVRNKIKLVNSLRKSPAESYFKNHIRQNAGFRLTTTVTEFEQGAPFCAHVGMMVS